MIAHASEDVGLANPSALLQAVAAMEALQYNGMPEARLNIAQAIIAICKSPKSNSVCLAVEAAMADAQRGGFGAVPAHLRDTHYRGHERLSGEKDAQYLYPHDFPGHYVAQEYMPEELRGRVYYRPSNMGEDV